MNKIIFSKECPSTHGGSGYCLGSRWDKGAIICGICGTRIENPPPTGGRWVLRKGFLNKLFNKGDWIPKWPEFIEGHK